MSSIYFPSTLTEFTSKISSPICKSDLSAEEPFKTKRKDMAAVDYCGFQNDKESMSLIKDGKSQFQS